MEVDQQRNVENKFVLNTTLYSLFDKSKSKKMVLELDKLKKLGKIAGYNFISHEMSENDGKLNSD